MNKKKTYKVKFPPPVLQLVADIISIFISYSLQYYLRFQSGLFGSHVQFVLSDFLLGAIFILIYWIVIFGFSGLYKNWYVRSPFDEFFTVLRVAFFGSLIFFLIWLFDSQNKEPRLLFLVYFAIIGFSVSLGRYLARKIQKVFRAKGIIVYPAVIVGNLNKVKDLYHQIINSKNWGYHTLGIILVDDYNTDTNEIEEIAKRENLPIVGNINNLTEKLDELKPKEVLISLESPNHSFLLDIVSQCADRRITVKIIPDLYDAFTGRTRTLHLYGIPLIEINTKLLKRWQEVAKRIFDIFFSFFVIIIGLPIWALIAAIIKLESKGPIFYKQVRVGKNGKEFEMIKYRSMVQDAEKKSGPQWTEVNDPRVTSFGKFIRKSHLDEVPQFWNVLKGQMSLVGPRPERPVFVEKFSKLIPYYKRRLIVRPGITGWWQVKYTTYVESKEEIESRLKDDFFYIENMSLRLDFEIIVRTVFLVIKGHGQT